MNVNITVRTVCPWWSNGYCMTGIETSIDLLVTYYVFISAVHIKGRKLHTTQPTQPSNSIGTDIRRPTRSPILPLPLRIFLGDLLRITLVIQIKSILNDSQILVEWPSV